ncbi:hypothetical protein ACFL3C_05095 [Patescibacteria group bacterium]
MGETNRRRPETKSANLNDPEKAALVKLYKSTQYIQLYNVPFTGDKTNPLIAKLKKLRKYRRYSVPGQILVDFYNGIKDKLDKEHPLVRRLFIGVLMRRLKYKGRSPGLKPFMNLIVAETGRLKPLLVKHIKELIQLVKDLPPGRYKDRMINELLTSGGIKGPLQRPGDPLFGKEGNAARGGEQPVEEYGLLEPITPVLGGNEILDPKTLDPLQLILYKRLVRGYNKLATTLPKKLAPLFAFHKLRYLKKKLYKAIHDFGAWIAETVKKMPITKVNELESIYRARVKALSLPSLPYKIDVPAPWFLKIPGITPSKIKKLRKLLTNIRGKAESSLRKAVLAEAKSIKRISQYAPMVLTQLKRRKMYRNSPTNRVFLNRIWDFVYAQYKSAPEGSKGEYEFYSMVLDSIKDDNELLSIIDKVKPLLVAVLKFNPEANKLSKAYFGKSFSQLSITEIESILKLLLPSRTLTVREKQTTVYKDGVAFMRRILFENLGVDAMKNKNHAKYLAMTTIAHRLVIIYTSLATERNVLKAKKRIAEFVQGFATMKKILGKEGMRALTIKAPGFAFVLKKPEQIVFFLKTIAEKQSVKAALSRFEKIHSLKHPPVVKAMMGRVQNIRKDLLGQEKAYKAQRDRAFKKGKLDYGVMKKIQAIRAEIKKMQHLVALLVETTTEAAFKKLEPVIKGLLYGTRSLKVSSRAQKQISFTAVEKSRRLKTNYDSLFYVSTHLQKYILMMIRMVYLNKGLKYEYAKISGAIKGIILTYGYEKQREIAKRGAYDYLRSPVERKAFIKEVVARVNGFLKTTKLTDKNHKVVPLMHITGSFEALVEGYIRSRIIPKAKRIARAKRKQRPPQAPGTKPT